jgi:OmpA-OmpF porin, OOP family
MSKILAFCCSFLLFSNIAFSQNFEVGLTLGATTYTGDIDVVAKNIGSASNPAIGLLVKYRLSNRFLVRGQILTSKLSASEKNHPLAWRQERGLSFESKLTEISGLLEYEVINKNRFTGFTFGGLGISYFNPKPDFNLPNTYIDDVNPDAQGDYKKHTLVVPLGIGLKYSLPKDFYLAAEVGYRFTFTDYLDGISKIANPKRNDAYYYTGLSLTKAFGGGKSGANRQFKQGDANCPKF